MCRSLSARVIARSAVDICGTANDFWPDPIQLCLPTVVVAVPEMWAWRESRGVQGPGAKFSSDPVGERLGKVCKPSGPGRSGGRYLARSGPPATIGRAEGNREKVRLGPDPSSAVGASASSLVNARAQSQPRTWQCCYRAGRGAGQLLTAGPHNHAGDAVAPDLPPGSWPTRPQVRPARVASACCFETRPWGCARDPTVTCHTGAET